MEPDSLFIPEDELLEYHRRAPFDQQSESESEPDDEFSEWATDEFDQPEEERYCFCSGPDIGFMIGCEGGCDGWFHGKCVGIKKKDEALIDVFICPKCTRTGTPATTWKEELGAQEAAEGYDRARRKIYQRMDIEGANDALNKTVQSGNRRGMLQEEEGIAKPKKPTHVPLKRQTSYAAAQGRVKATNPSARLAHRPRATSQHDNASPQRTMSTARAAACRAKEHDLLAKGMTESIKIEVDSADGFSDYELPDAKQLLATNKLTCGDESMDTKQEIYQPIDPAALEHLYAYKVVKEAMEASFVGAPA